MLAAWALPLANAAAAPDVCGNRGVFVSELELSYGERKAGDGLTDAGGILELYVSEAGTWTLLLALPVGIACVIETGDAWQAWPAAKPAPETREN